MIWNRDDFRLLYRIGTGLYSHRCQKNANEMVQQSIRKRFDEATDGMTVDQLSIILVGLVGGIFYFRNLGTLPLEFWDEAIYANAAANMLEGHWLIPRVAWTPADPNSPAPLFLEKPPLVMWLQALSMLVFGVTTFAVRLPTVLATLTVAVLVYHIGTEVYDRYVGLSGAFVFLLLPAVYWNSHSGRTGDTDMLLTLFGTLFVWWVWRGKQDSRLLIPAGVAAGLAVMTKGVAAGVFVVTVLPLVVVDWREYVTREALIGASLTLLVALPWHLYAYLRYPDEFVRQMFSTQVVGRMFGHSRGEPIFDWMSYPYLKSLPNYIKPFWASVLLGLAVVSKDAYDDGWRSRTADLVFVWWFIAPIVTFSLLGGDHGWYLLPLVVPASILSGRGASAAVSVVNSTSRKRLDRRLLSYRTFTVLGVLTVVVMFAVYPAPKIARWDDHREIAQSFDGAPDDETIYVHEGIDERSFILSFYTQRPLEPTDTAELSSGPSVRYAVVPASELDRIDREYEVLERSEELNRVTIRLRST